MKKIGFIDYYISEWHANNYPAWVKERSANVGEDFEVAYAWAEVDVGERDGVTTDQWCEKFNCENCASIAELCKKSDYIMLLSPSNPEKHLEYAEEAFKNCDGKRMYIDKTFAPDSDTAKKIYDLSVKYGVEFFTTSALRYADELKGYKNVKSAFITGGGRNCPEYIIHQIEMCVKTMGAGATKIKMNVDAEGTNVFEIAYKDGRTAKLNYNPEFSFGAKIDDGKEVKQYEIGEGFFPNLIEGILRFFNGEPVPFSFDETMEVMKIREALIVALENENVWVDLKC